MGLFAIEPEDVNDWAGLPAEPVEHDDRSSASEQLSDDGLMVGLFGGTTSVPVERLPQVDVDDDDADDADDDEAEQDGDRDAPTP